MGFKFNPITWKLDIAGWWASAASVNPQTGTGSPAGSVASRFAGDRYLDTNSGILYTNPNASGSTGWEIIMTEPA